MKNSLCFAKNIKVVYTQQTAHTCEGKCIFLWEIFRTDMIILLLPNSTNFLFFSWHSLNVCNSANVLKFIQIAMPIVAAHWIDFTIDFRTRKSEVEFNASTFNQLISWDSTAVSFLLSTFNSVCREEAEVSLLVASPDFVNWRRGEADCSLKF